MWAALPYSLPILKGLKKFEGGIFAYTNSAMCKEEQGKMKLYGNSRALERLQSCASRERLPHALLFFGDSGTGKRTLADYTAMLYFCDNAKDNALTAPCMSCNSCKRVESHIHPDVIYADCAATSAEEMREMLKSTFELPVEGKIRVYVLTEFQLLNRECQNALLTYLEEPSDKIRFILTASNRNGILPTILSRTALIQTEPLSLPECEQALTDRGCENAERLAAECGGNLGLALKMTSDKNSAVYIELSKELAEYICQKSEYDALMLMQRLPQPKDDKREPVRAIITETAKIFHDAFVYSRGGTPASGSCRELSKEMAERFKPSELNEICEKAEQFGRTVTDANFNSKITANAFIAEIFAVIKRK